MFCYMIYDSTPIKYANLEESFGGFINSRSLIRFEYEKSPLHTIVYGGTGTSKTYFVRQYLKLYQDRDQDQCQDQHQDQDHNQNQNQYNKYIIIVCKEDRDWIDPETREFYTGFNTCDTKI